MKINAHEVHVWIIDLLISSEEEAIQLDSLSMEEQNKVQQIRFPLHKKRYIAAHFALRKILSHYLGVSLQTIAFYMNQQKKPF